MKYLMIISEEFVFLLANLQIHFLLCGVMVTKLD